MYTDRQKVELVIFEGGKKISIKMEEYATLLDYHNNKERNKTKQRKLKVVQR